MKNILKVILFTIMLFTMSVSYVNAATGTECESYLKRLGLTTISSLNTYTQENDSGVISGSLSLIYYGEDNYNNIAYVIRGEDSCTVTSKFLQTLLDMIYEDGVTNIIFDTENTVKVVYKDKELVFNRTSNIMGLSGLLLYENSGYNFDNLFNEIQEGYAYRDYVNSPELGNFEYPCIYNKEDFDLSLGDGVKKLTLNTKNLSNHCCVDIDGSELNKFIYYGNSVSIRTVYASCLNTMEFYTDNVYDDIENCAVSFDNMEYCPNLKSIKVERNEYSGDYFSVSFAKEIEKNYYNSTKVCGWLVEDDNSDSCFSDKRSKFHEKYVEGRYITDHEYKTNGSSINFTAVQPWVNITYYTNKDNSLKKSVKDVYLPDLMYKPYDETFDYTSKIADRYRSTIIPQYLVNIRTDNVKYTGKNPLSKLLFNEKTSNVFGCPFLWNVDLDDIFKALKRGTPDTNTELGVDVGVEYDDLLVQVIKTLDENTPTEYYYNSRIKSNEDIIFETPVKPNYELVGYKVFAGFKITNATSSTPSSQIYDNNLTVNAVTDELVDYTISGKNTIIKGGQFVQGVQFIPVWKKTDPSNEEMQVVVLSEDGQITYYQNIQLNKEDIEFDTPVKDGYTIYNYKVIGGYKIVDATSSTDTSEIFGDNKTLQQVYNEDTVEYKIVENKTIIKSGQYAYGLILVPEWGMCSHTKTNVINKKDVTCIENGYTGDVFCLDCNKIITQGSTIKSTGHKYDKGVIIVKPTTETTGVVKYTCTSCSNTYTEMVDKLTSESEEGKENENNNKPSSDNKENENNNTSSSDNKVSDDKENENNNTSSSDNKVSDDKENEVKKNLSNNSTKISLKLKYKKIYYKTTLVKDKGIKFNIALYKDKKCKKRIYSKSGIKSSRTISINKKIKKGTTYYLRIKYYKGSKCKNTVVKKVRFK